MKTTYKTLLVCLAAAFTFVLVGCGDKAAETTQTAEEAESEAAAMKEMEAYESGEAERTE